MVVANFGMGIRPSSSIVQTDQERANAAKRKTASLQARQASLTANINDRAQQFAEQRAAQNPLLTDAQRANVADYLASMYTGAGLSNPDVIAPVHTTNDPSPWSAQLRDNGELNRVNTALSRAPAAAQMQQNAITASQGAQQSAYDQFLGGFGTGGVLGSVSQAGTRDPSQPTASMPWGQPWSTPGFGNPGSLGGLGGYKPSGQQGWGSVFGGGRNPWSLA